MKKISAILASLLLIFTSFLVACMGTGGDSNASLGEGGFSKKEVSNVYREIAEQMFEKIGVSITLPEQTPENANFAIVVPDKKTETQDEGAIKNIQVNAKDAAGIMYLMSMLYSNENYVTVNGLAGFDATYAQFGDNVTQTIYLNTSINKDIGRVNFEALVTTHTYNTWGYTNAEFTFDFSTMKLHECRFMMADDTDCVDMMLTSDGRYMWYRTAEMDDFASALYSLKGEFDQKCKSVQKLTTDFGPQMEEYIRVTFEAGQQVGPAPSLPEGPSGPNDDIQGGEIGTDEMKPVNPEDRQVSSEDWERLMSLDQVEDHITYIDYGTVAQVTTSISYRCDGYMIEKFVTDVMSGRITSATFYDYDEVSGKYYRYDTSGEKDKNITQTEITEQEYLSERSKAKASYLSDFIYDDFVYNEMGFYSMSFEALSKYQEDGVLSAELSFSSGKLMGVNFIIRNEDGNDIQYSIGFNYDENIELFPPIQQK